MTQEGAMENRVREALERLRERHAPTCTPETCVYVADLALVAAALDAGAGEERARAIEECAVIAEHHAPQVVADAIRALLLPPAAPERGCSRHLGAPSDTCSHPDCMRVASERGCGPEGEPDTTTMKEIRQWRRPAPERGEGG
jgi:hypothetical protein